MCSPAQRVSLCNGDVNESRNRARTEGRGGCYKSATHAICYFALSATRSLIKPPSPHSPCIFQTRDNIRHTAWQLGCAPPFFHPLFLSFLLPGNLPCSLARTNTSRWPNKAGEKERQDFIKGTPDCERFVPLMKIYINDMYSKYCFTEGDVCDY